MIWTEFVFCITQDLRGNISFLVNYYDTIHSYHDSQSYDSRPLHFPAPIRMQQISEDSESLSLLLKLTFGKIYVCLVRARRERRKKWEKIRLLSFQGLWRINTSCSCNKCYNLLKLPYNIIYLHSTIRLSIITLKIHFTIHAQPYITYFLGRNTNSGIWYTLTLKVQ